MLLSGGDGEAEEGGGGGGGGGQRKGAVGADSPQPGTGAGWKTGGGADSTGERCGDHTVGVKIWNGDTGK